MSNAVILLLAAVASADEPITVKRPEEPRIGFTARASVTLTDRGANPGLRGGLRIKLSDFFALALVAAWDLEFYDRPISAPLNPTSTAPKANGHLAQGVLRLEFFSTSAFVHVLIPALALSAFFGLGVLHQPALADWAAFTIPLARAGLSISVTRLWRSGWWFPIFLELGQEFSPGRRTDPAWYAAAGVGF